MPWDSVSPYHGSHLMSTRMMFCGYDFTLEQLDETCSRKKKCVWEFLFCMLLLSVFSLSWGQSNPPIICVYELQQVLGAIRQSVYL